MLLIVTTVEFLTKGDYWGRWAVLPKASQYLPEILGGLAIVIVVALGTGNRFKYVRPEYWLFFGALALVAACGVLINSVEPGTTFAGLRTYLRALPWFFIPAVYAFSERQIRTQLKLLLVICLIQVPLAGQQLLTTRSRYFGSFYSGDWITGSMMISSMLSLLLIGAVCVVTAFRLRRRITTRQFLVLFALLLLPTTVNETKGTVVLLPIALMIVLLVASAAKVRFKYAVVTTLLLVGFLAMFVPIYNHLMSARIHPVSLADYVTEPQKLRRYMLKGREIGATEPAGRIDSIVVSTEFVADDPVTLGFGLGIGNVSDSALGKGFVGAYSEMFQPFLVTSYARVMLEMGAIGVVCLVMIYWLIFADARAVARQDDTFIGALAAGWTSVTAIMLIALFYKDVVTHTPLSFLFWYFSGLIAAQRVRELAPARTDTTRQA